MALRASGGSSVVELLPSKQAVAGSSPVPRSSHFVSKKPCSTIGGVLFYDNK